MTTTSRVHWWTSLALLPVAGLMAWVFFGPTQGLAIIGRPAGDREILRVAYTADLRPDPHNRIFPLAQYNLLALSLWEPLVECDPATGRPQPAAAASWAWSADGLELTLKLRPDARWSNGDPVTAQDFVRGWRRLLETDKSLGMALAPLKNAEAYLEGHLKDITRVGIEARDDLTLVLSLDQPRSTLVVELADPLLAPLHPTSAATFDVNTFCATPASLVGNGPFRLGRAGPDGFELEANPHYHDRAAVRLAGVRFIRADNPNVAQLLVDAGLADIFSPTPYGSARSQPTARPVSLESELELGVSAVYFNTSRGVLRDPRVRRALALALNRAAPIQRYDPGHMVPAWSWVPAMTGRPGLKLLQEDATEAGRLLAAAGYPAGKGLPVLHLALPAWQRRNPFPAAIAEHWFQALGVRTYITYEPVGQWETRIMAGDYDLEYGAIVATVSDAGDLLSVFLDPPATSGTKWADPEVTRLLRGADQLTGAARLAALEQAERAVMAALPCVPVMFERRQTMRTEEVHGWYVDSLARQNLKRLWLDAAPEAGHPPATSL